MSMSAETILVDPKLDVLMNLEATNANVPKVLEVILTLLDVLVLAELNVTKMKIALVSWLAKIKFVSIHAVRCHVERVLFAYQNVTQHGVDVKVALKKTKRLENA